MPGKRGVLVTRPAGRGERLVEALRAREWPVFQVPCLDLEPIRFPHQPPEIAALDTFAKVITISPTAAELALALVDAYWPQWPVAQTWLATGRQTASVLEKAQPGLHVLCPGPLQENAEGLLALPALQSVCAERVLIIKGVGGRMLLHEELQERGAQVQTLDLYRRIRPEAGADALQALLVNETIGVSVVLSGDTLSNLTHFAGGLASRLRKVPICVPGERLAERARTEGFRAVIMAENAGTEALLRALDGWRHTSEQQ